MGVGAGLGIAVFMYGDPHMRAYIFPLAVVMVLAGIVDLTVRR